MRVDANSVRAKVICEGGNLGVTQLGRIEFALQGGKIPGADTRCLSNGISSLSAFIRVAKPTNSEDSLYLHLNVNNTQPGIDPIDTLQDLFDDWYAENPDLVTIQIDFNEGWNLVGLPVYIDDAEYGSMFPEAITGTLFLLILDILLRVN